MVLNLGCCSVLIFWVELRLTVTLPCFAANSVLSNFGYSSPSPPLKTMTSTFEPSATPNGLSGDVAPVAVVLSVGLPAQAASRLPAGVTIRPANAARWSRARRDIGVR